MSSNSPYNIRLAAIDHLITMPITASESIYLTSATCNSGTYVFTASPGSGTLATTFTATHTVLASDPSATLSSCTFAFTDKDLNAGNTATLTSPTDCTMTVGEWLWGRLAAGCNRI
jgi:hypothetical protein